MVTPGQGDDVQLQKKLPGSVDASEGLEKCIPALGHQMHAWNFQQGLSQKSIA